MLVIFRYTFSSCKSVEWHASHFSDAFLDLKPDLILLMGDRYELLATAVALLMKIRIAHISGGDTTEGAYDEAIRHSITEMFIYFVTNTDAFKRVKQLGKRSEYILM